MKTLIALSLLFIAVEVQAVTYVGDVHANISYYSSSLSPYTRGYSQNHVGTAVINDDLSFFIDLTSFSEVVQTELRHEGPEINGRHPIIDSIIRVTGALVPRGDYYATAEHVSFGYFNSSTPEIVYNVTASFGEFRLVGNTFSGSGELPFIYGDWVDFGIYGPVTEQQLPEPASLLLMLSGLPYLRRRHAAH